MKLFRILIIVGLAAVVLFVANKTFNTPAPAEPTEQVDTTAAPVDSTVTDSTVQDSVD